MRRQSRVFADGALIGLVDDPQDLVSRMREMRRRGELSSEVNVSYKDFNNDVIIHTDRGRARRPLIVVRDGRPEVTEEDIEHIRNNEMTFEDLVQKGAVEFIDAEEEEDLFIAINEVDLTAEHTHLEIDPSLILVSRRRMFLSPSITPVPVSPWVQGWSNRRSGLARRT
jgi:DNA-directed RNA polymerase subunit B'